LASFWQVEPRACDRRDRDGPTLLASLMGHESSSITERRYIYLFDRQCADEAVRRSDGGCGLL
jgi:integrase